MEIIGDDKKLRALYSEAKRADGAAMPSFTSVWHRAQARSLKPRRAFNLSFALVTALLVLTLGSLAVWSMYSTRSHQSHEAASNQPKPDAVVPPTANSPETASPGDDVRVADKGPSTPIERPVHRSIRTRVKRSTSGDAQLLAANQTTIETWQSPTAGLLSSPTDGLFKSVPQLNENAKEMKSFLPGRSNDKEK